jgi:hypothetical protein
MRQIRPGGVGTYFNCDGVVEVETSTCAHCQRMTDIPSRRKMQDVVDICRGCMKLICLECVGKPCIPIMKRIEAQEEAFYRRQQLSKMMGV